MPSNTRWTCPAFVLLVTAATFLLKSERFFAPVASDSGLFAYTASSLLDGAVLFRDTPFAFRLPGVYLVDALAMTVLGQGSLAIQVLDAAWTGLSALALAYLLRGLFRPSTVVAATMLFLVLVSAPALAESGNTSDAYLVLPTIIAVRYVVFATQPSSTGRALVMAGLAFGFAVLFKQPAILVPTALALALVGLWHRDGLPWSVITRRCALFIASLSLPLLVLVAFTVAEGTFTNMVYEVVVFPLQAAAAGRNPLVKVDLFLRAVEVMGFFLFPAFALCLVSAVVLFQGRVPLRRTHCVLIVWLGGTVLSALASGAGSGHYYLPVVPSMCAFAAIGIEWATSGEGVLRRYSSRGRLALMAFVVGIMLLPNLARDLSEFQSGFLRYLRDPPAATSMEQLAQFVRVRTDPADYIYGYGSHKYVSVAFIARRRFATRHVSPKMFDGRGYADGNFPRPDQLSWMPEELQQDIIRNRPKLIFGFTDEALAEAPYADLESWIRANYAQLDPDSLPLSLRLEENEDVLPIRVLAR